MSRLYANATCSRSSAAVGWRGRRRRDAIMRDMIRRMSVVLVLLPASVATGVMFVEDAGASGHAATENPPHAAIAIARARTALLRAVQRLPLSEGLTVADWAARDPEIDRNLRRWVRCRQPVGGVRRFSDGSCAASARIRPQELSEWFRRFGVRGQAAAGTDSPSEAALRAAARTWSTVWGVGWSEAAERIEEGLPPGWEDVTIGGVSAAQAAAREAALRRLVVEIEATPLAGAWTVGALTGSDAVIHEALLGALRHAASIDVTFAPEQLAVANASISRGELVRLLSELYDRYYLGQQLARGDIQELMLRSGAALYEGVAAVPPPQSAHTSPAGTTSAELRKLAATEFKAAGCRVTGCGAPLPAAALATLARADAEHALRRQIAGQALSSGETVDQWLRTDPLFRADVDTLVRGVSMSQENVVAGVAVVRVKVSGATLARLLDAAQRRRASRRPPAP
ncbi:MAG: hypothetical protein D6744_08295 [Planctomycetota bacterium]|nr:MAG: hypothetical protein D6744_08295 [Planctomycetota bacterium]